MTQFPDSLPFYLLTLKIEHPGLTFPGPHLPKSAPLVGPPSKLWSHHSCLLSPAPCIVLASFCKGKYSLCKHASKIPLRSMVSKNLVSNPCGTGKENRPLDISDREQKHNENNLINTTK